MRVAIYSRVSTKDKGQDPENQAATLRAYCAHHGHELVREYVDEVTGSRADRQQFLEMFEAARRREFDLVLFWALDRFTREGVLETLNYLQKLTSYGVHWQSYSEAYLDSTGVFREAIIAILAALAKQERIRIQERVHAGLERARKEGKKLGPKFKIFDREAAKLYAQTHSLRDTAAEFDISRETVRRLLCPKP